MQLLCNLNSMTIEAETQEFLLFQDQRTRALLRMNKNAPP